MASSEIGLIWWFFGAVLGDDRDAETEDSAVNGTLGQAVEKASALMCNMSSHFVIIEYDIEHIF